VKAPEPKRAVVGLRNPLAQRNIVVAPKKADDDDLELDFGDDCAKPQKLFSMKASAANLKCYPGMKPNLPVM